MKAYIFPGQGAQFPGMGLDLYENSTLAKQLFDQANEILGFDITEILFHGTEAQLKETKVTQPAVFLHSVILAKVLGNDFQPEMVAGHSLGELSALVASEVLTFEDGLNLVSKRAMAMQKACELAPSTMAAVLGLENTLVEEVCASIDGVVVAAARGAPPHCILDIPGADARALLQAAAYADTASECRSDCKTCVEAISAGEHGPARPSARLPEFRSPPRPPGSARTRSTGLRVDACPHQSE